LRIRLKIVSASKEDDIEAAKDEVEEKAHFNERRLGSIIFCLQQLPYHSYFAGFGQQGQWVLFGHGALRVQ
jgi:hypothetical protein